MEHETNTIPWFDVYPRRLKQGQSLQDAYALLQKRERGNTTTPIALRLGRRDCRPGRRKHEWDVGIVIQTMALVSKFSAAVQMMEFEFPPCDLMVQLVSATTSLKKLCCPVTSGADIDLISGAFARCPQLEYLSIQPERQPVDDSLKRSMLQAVKRLTALKHLELCLAFSCFTKEAQALMLNLAQHETTAPLTLEISFTANEKGQHSNELLSTLAEMVEKGQPMLKLKLSFYGDASLLQSNPAGFNQFLSAVMQFPGRCAFQEIRLYNAHTTLALAFLRSAAFVRIEWLDLGGRSLITDEGTLAPLLDSVPNANVPHLYIEDDNDVDDCFSVESVEARIASAVHQNSTVVRGRLKFWRQDLAKDSLAPIFERNKAIAAIRGGRHIPVSLVPFSLGRLGHRKLGSAPAYMILRSLIGPCLEHSNSKVSNKRKWDTANCGVL